ncbi:MAG TPA: cytochrome C oxidase subunit IV family protein [Lentimicrobium sp.]|nr:cytochrome C oxidase subunit IV family protein [Lentimicrobium sp.]
MSNENGHISSYKDHLMVLLGLITLTIITVAITSVELNAFNVVAALVIAACKATIVLLYFMHLRFDERIFLIMAVLVLLLLCAVIGVTLFDYLDL